MFDKLERVCETARERKSLVTAADRLLVRVNTSGNLCAMDCAPHIAQAASMLRDWHSGAAADCIRAAAAALPPLANSYGFDSETRQNAAADKRREAEQTAAQIAAILRAAI